MLRLLAVICGLCVSGALLAAPPIQRWETENGARVYFIPTDALPIVDLRLTFHAGASRDSGLPGLASMTSSLLDQGAGGRDAGDLARSLEAVGARLSTGSARDMAWVHLRSLSRTEALNSAAATLKLMLGQPDFPADALARTRRRMLVHLQALKQSPAALAERSFYTALYGDHPYGSPPTGTEQSLPNIDRDDVRAFYQRYYVAANAVVAIVGALDRREAEQLAEQVAGQLPAGEAAPPLPPVDPPEGGIVEVPFASSQTHIVMGQPAATRDSPDYFPLYVGNHILGGGGLVSVLAREMREERGLSYSSYSYFSFMSQRGPFVMGSQVRSDRRAEAVEVLRSVLLKLRNDGPTAEQLEMAKANITGSFPLQLNSNSDLVAYLAVIGFYDLPLDYLDRYIDKIRAVTAEEVRAAFQAHIDPARLATVLVGPQDAAE